MRYLHIAYVALATSLLCGCAAVEAPRRDGGGDTVAVRWVAAAENPSVRSAFTGDESAINQTYIAVYRNSDGKFVTEGYNPSGSDVALAIPSGLDYTFLVLCNCGKAEAAADLESMRASDIEVSEAIASSGLFPDGLPMAGDTTISIDGSVDLQFKVRRMVSRWDFSFVDQDAVGYSVESVTMRGCPADFQPWARDVDGQLRSVPSKTVDGDWASASDLEAINSSSDISGTASFYVLENMGGTVGGIDAEDGRSYDNDSLSAEFKSMRTYAEVGLSFPDGADFTRRDDRADAGHDVVYRYYLGDNETDNFDVHRNKAMSLSMTGTRSGITSSISDGGDSWRVEANVREQVIRTTNVFAGMVFYISSITIENPSDMKNVRIGFSADGSDAFSATGVEHMAGGRNFYYDEDTGKLWFSSSKVTDNNFYIFADGYLPKLISVPNLSGPYVNFSNCGNLFTGKWFHNMEASDVTNLQEDYYELVAGSEVTLEAKNNITSGVSCLLSEHKDRSYDKTLYEEYYDDSVTFFLTIIHYDIPSEVSYKSKLIPYLSIEGNVLKLSGDCPEEYYDILYLYTVNVSNAYDDVDYGGVILRHPSE